MTMPGRDFTTDTIFALSTAPGRAGVAVIRVSGPGAWGSLGKLISTNSQNGISRVSGNLEDPRLHGGGSIVERYAVLRVLRDPFTQEIIDRALVLGFRAPASFTGEDVVEYHVHGGRAVVGSLLAALAAQDNHRMAEPGEFTRRAFENGKLDLTEAEAVADLIDAETQAQKIQALAQMEGSLSRLYNDWTERLKKTLAHAEADIEFPDEDLPDEIIPRLRPAIEKLITEISAHLDDNRRGERLRDGIHVAVIGAPNAGKSSLVNALAQRDVAIISDLPGTTRDVIEVHLDIGGYPVILSDTAGLNPLSLQGEGRGEGGATHASIESEGIRRALQRAREADIKILLFDSTADRPDESTLALMDENAVAVFNKADKAKESPLPIGERVRVRGEKPVRGGNNNPSPGPPSLRYGAPPSPEGRGDFIPISALTGAGIDALLAALAAKIKTIAGNPETPSLTRRRHRAALEEARESLRRALSAPLPEMTAEDMRLAIRSIGRITGRVDVEDILDVVFRDFCIGK